VTILSIYGGKQKLTNNDRRKLTNKWRDKMVKQLDINEIHFINTNLKKFLSKRGMEMLLRVILVDKYWEQSTKPVIVELMEVIQDKTLENVGMKKTLFFDRGPEYGAIEVN